MRYNISQCKNVQMDWHYFVGAFTRSRRRNMFYRFVCQETGLQRILECFADTVFYHVNFQDSDNVGRHSPPCSPYKLRISVHEMEVQRIFEPLFDIFFHSQNVDAFKVFSEDLALRNPMPHTDRYKYCMQFTIYLKPSSERNPEMMPGTDQARVLIDRINDALSSMNVAMGRPTPLDVPIEGYLSGRVDHVLNRSGTLQYISESDLMLPCYHRLRTRLNNKFHKFIEFMWPPF